MFISYLLKYSSVNPIYIIYIITLLWPAPVRSGNTNTYNTVSQVLLKL